MPEFLGNEGRWQVNSLPPSCIICIGQRLVAAEVDYPDPDDGYEVYSDEVVLTIEYERGMLPEGTAYIKEIEGVSYISGKEEIAWELGSFRKVKIDCHPLQCDISKT